MLEWLRNTDSTSPDGGTLTGPDAQEAAAEIGARSLPYLTRIRDHVQGVKAVTLGTKDGIHLCSVGMANHDDAARLAALNSSMYGVAGAQVELMGHTAQGNGRETVVAVTMPGEIMIVVSLAFAPLGNLLLSASAEDTQLGMVIVQTRDAADALAGWLSTTFPVTESPPG